MKLLVVRSATYFALDFCCCIVPILLLTTTVLTFLLKRSNRKTDESKVKLLQPELRYRKHKRELLQSTSENRLLTDKVSNLEQDCIEKESIISQNKKGSQRASSNNQKLKDELENRAAAIKLYQKLYSSSKLFIKR